MRTYYLHLLVRLGFIVLIGCWGYTFSESKDSLAYTCRSSDAKQAIDTLPQESLSYTRSDTSLIPRFLYRLAPLRRAGKDAAFDLFDSITPWVYRLGSHYKSLNTLIRKQDTRPRPESHFLSLSSSILFGRNMLVGQKWLLGLDGLVFLFPEINSVDGLWCGYELYLAYQLSTNAKIAARANAYYTTKRNRFVSHSYLTLHYAPQRDGLLLVGGGVSTGNVNLLNGHQIFLQRYPSGALGNGPVRTYERQWGILRHEIDLIPFLGFDLTALYEHRQPVMPGTLSHTHRALTIESRLRIQPTGHNQRSLYDDAAYALPIGLKIPEFYLTYRQAIPLATKSALPYSDYGRAEVNVKGYLYVNDYTHIQYYLAGGVYLWQKQQSEWDRKSFPTANVVTFDHLFHTYQALYPTYYAGKQWGEIQMTYLSRKLLSRKIDWGTKFPLDEALHIRTILPFNKDRKAYTETGYSIGWSYMARLGLFYGFEYGGGHKALVIRLSLPLLQITRLWGERIPICTSNR